jgi:hypothetical protein
MSDTLQQPQNPAEQAEVDYGEHIIFKLVGSRVVSFGANAAGEIFLQTEKNGQFTEVLIGKDERGDIALFEPEIVPVETPA